MNRLMRRNEEAGTTEASLPAWLFEPYPLKVSASQRMYQRVAIRLLLRRANAARMVS